jgi:hypothetical protein
MSVTIDYFFNYSKPLPELAKDVNECLGCSLAAYEGDPDDLFDRFLSMEFSLHVADSYENDRELDFENFRYALGFRTPWGEADARPIQVGAMAIVIYALHRSLGITGILVFDMQTLLARYEEREIPEYGKRLYDVLSDSAFVSLSSHLEKLKARLRDYWKEF